MQKPIGVFSRPGMFLAVALSLLTGGLSVHAQVDQIVYGDSLQSGWEDWGWAPHDYANTAPVHGGARSVSVTMDSGSQALYIHHAQFDTAPYTNLTFWIHGGSGGGQLLRVIGLAGGAHQGGTDLPALAANTWTEFVVPLSSLGCANRPDMDAVWFQDRSGSAQPTFYLDDIKLVAGAPPPVITNVVATIHVNVLSNRHAISPEIYGVAFASTALLADLNAPLNRSGGNAETRYNWLLNAHNRGADWYFESIGDSPPVPGAGADAHVSASKAGGAEPMLTVPMLGWMPKLGPSRGKLASYSIAEYGPQTGNDASWMPDAGNGISVTNNTPITWNDPTDANFPTNSNFQHGWIQHLVTQWGASTNGGVRYYLMDNEHSIWHSTHRDVHPVGASMEEIRDKMFDYASLVKTIDPDALVIGPEEYGWSGFFNSGLDQQTGTQVDRNSHGGWDYLPWLLDQFRQRDTSAGQRLLDYFTVHCYPEQGSVSSGAVDEATQLLRNRLTRKFWDPTYVDQTWINQVVKLIPRIKGWVDSYYPGTRTGITEYNWGAEDHINGATAQADILGIFGREGLDLATRWTTPASTTPTYKAMKLFRNYDGNRSTFGDISVSALINTNVDLISAFAAVRSSDGALTIMVVNKQREGVGTLTFDLANFPPLGSAQVWQLTSNNVISQLSDVTFTGGAFTGTVPIQSITLYVLPVAGAPVLSNPAWTSAAFSCRLDGQAGQSYAIQASGDLATWITLQTNLLVSNSQQFALPATNGFQFYRAQWLP